MAAAAEADVRLPLLIAADRQTAGRGRGTNRWWTGPGSLAFSLLMRNVGWDQRVQASAGPPASVSGAPALASLAAGLAVVDAIAPLVPGHQFGIHWPNDVMLDGRKLAGILIEALPQGRQVIGIGINTNNSAADAPAEVRSRVATLRDATGRTHDSAELLIFILNRLRERLVELACAGSHCGTDERTLLAAWSRRSDSAGRADYPRNLRGNRGGWCNAACARRKDSRGLFGDRRIGMMPKLIVRGSRSGETVPTAFARRVQPTSARSWPARAMAAWAAGWRGRRQPGRNSSARRRRAWRRRLPARSWWKCSSDSAAR